MFDRKIILAVVGAITVLAHSPMVQAAEFDAAMAWPLCGRISEAPPVGWQESDGCPVDRHGNADYTDLPLSSTYGPRWLASENRRYDFHRGLDIASSIGTPVFAITDGVVRIAGTHSSYEDPLVQLRHYRPGHSSCTNVGCYHSNYMHMDSVVVAVDQLVTKGQLIGYTGKSKSDFEHLHFEVRDAPAYDVYSNWSRDAVHPLGILPFTSSDAIDLTIDNVDQSNANNPVLEATVTTPRPDIQRVEVTLYDNTGAVLSQDGNLADSYGYNIYPSWFDMNDGNRQYTHKNSSNFPWSSYDIDGDNECPYAHDHGSGYSANVHMDQAASDDYQEGHFNGVRIGTGFYSTGTYHLNLTFEELSGAPACIKVQALPISGAPVEAQWGDCSFDGGGGSGGGNGGGKDKPKGGGGSGKGGGKGKNK